MLNGDEKGAARVAKFADAVAPAMLAPISAKRRTRRGVQGDEVCPHRILAGSMKPWTYRARDIGRAPAPVSIIVPMTSNADAGAESFAYRAAVALALAAPLQKAGYRVQVLAADCTRNSFTSGPRYAFVVHKVASGVCLDVPRLSATLSAPHLRHITFAILAASGWRVCGGLGQAEDDIGRYATLAVASGMVHAGDECLIIPPTIRDERAARAWLAQTSARYGKGAQ
jgi:hypothetical protein